jgi:hypothetical protein
MPNAAILAQELHRLADAVARLDRAGDWVSAWESGDAVTSDEIARICACSPDTARRRHEASVIEGFPLAVRHAGIYVFSLARMLAWVEQHQGRPARLACESRVRKSMNLRLQPQKVPEIAPDAAVTAS